MTEREKRTTDSALARPHVLIVTDDPGLQAFLSEGLVLGGFWTSVVASGLQVLEIFRIRTFDLMLIDAAMIGMSSLEVIARLRGRSPHASLTAARTDVPIWLIAEHQSDVSSEAIAQSGADGVLVAPLELESLVPQLHQIVVDWRSAHPDRPWADEQATK